MSIYDYIESRMSDPHLINEDLHPLENIPKDKRIEIIEACADDVPLFISLLRVPSPEGYVRIVPYEKQREIIDTIENDHYLALLGSRQTGKTTIVQGIVCHYTTFQENYKVGILMQRDGSVKDFIAEVYKLMLSLPTWLAPKTIVDNAKEKKFINGSKIEGHTIDPKNPDAVGRGLRVDFLIIDECAFIDNIAKAYTALKPATSRRHLKLKKAGLPYGTVLITTPNGTTGTGQWFYEQWIKAVNGETIFKAIRFHWSEVPEYDDEWYKEATSDMSEREANQEYELKFLGSSDSWLPDSVVEKLQDQSNYESIKASIKLHVGKIHLLKEIDNNSVYIVGADSADSGEDFAAMLIMDYFTEEIVGYYYDQKVSALDFAKDVYKLAKLIPNSVIIFEKNSLGTTSAQMLYRELGPSRIYVHKKYRFKKQAFDHPGFSTNSQTRKLMFSSIYSFVEKNPDKLKAAQLVYELISLVQKGNRVEAGKGAHDDLVLTLGFILYFLDHDIPDEYITQFNIKTESSENQKAIMEMVASFNANAKSYEEEKAIVSSVSSKTLADSLNNSEPSALSDSFIHDSIAEDIEKEKEKQQIFDSIFGSF